MCKVIHEVEQGVCACVCVYVGTDINLRTIEKVSGTLPFSWYIFISLNVEIL